MPVHNFDFRDPNTNQPNPSGLLQVGAILPVEVHVPDIIANQLTSSGQPVPNPVSGMALIDTGCTLTSVDDQAMQSLNLPPVNVVNTLTASGPAQQNQYPVKLEFPGHGISMAIQAATGVNLTGQIIPTTPPQNILVLIGRDFLARTQLVWNGKYGMWSLSV